MMTRNVLAAQPGGDLERNLAGGDDLRHFVDKHTEKRLTRKQLFYLLGLQGLGAAVLDGVINFGIATAMYRTTKKEIRLWPLSKNTIAGDMGLTVIIQTMLSSVIVGILVRSDIRAKKVDPFVHPWPSTTKLHHGTKFQRRFAAVLDFSSPVETITLSYGWKTLAKRLFMIILRGFIMSFFYFIIFWPIAIAITAPLYGGIDMRGTWTPEIIKALFGGLLGLFQNPLLAALVFGASYSSSTTETAPSAAPRPASMEELRPNIVANLPSQPAKILTTTSVRALSPEIRTNVNHNNLRPPVPSRSPLRQSSLIRSSKNPFKTEIAHSTS